MTSPRKKTPTPPLAKGVVEIKRIQVINQLQDNIHQILVELNTFEAKHPELKHPDLANTISTHKAIIAPHAINSPGKKLRSDLFSDEHENELKKIIAQHEEWKKVILIPLTPSRPPTRVLAEEFTIIAETPDSTKHYLSEWKSKIAQMPSGEKIEAELKRRQFKQSYAVHSSKMAAEEKALAIKIFDDKMNDAYGLLLHKISTNSKLQSKYEEANECLEKWEGEIQRYPTTTPARKDAIKHFCHDLRLAVGTNDIDKIKKSLLQFETPEMKKIKERIPVMSSEAKKLDRTVQSQIAKIKAGMAKDEEENIKKKREPDKVKLALKTDKLKALEETSRYLQNELTREGLDNVLKERFRYDWASGRSTTKTLVTLACQLKEKEARPTMAVDANAKKSFSLGNFGKK